MALAFGLLPTNVSVLPSEFTFHIPDQNINELQSLISTANLAPKTWYEEHTDDGSYGISRDWLIEAKNLWIGDFDWRDQERKINSYPNYKINLTDSEGGDIELHFAALFSQKDDAVPVIFLHGWPSSFLEFFPFMDLVSEKYTPDSLPYHVIVPSIPSYGLSSDLSSDVQTTYPIVGRVMNSLMTSLGFDSYVAQAGDFGSLVAQQMCYDHEACKAFHPWDSPFDYWTGHVNKPGRLVSMSHENGGHFAAFEQPQEFLQDVEEFLSKVEGL
ncbi:epoxide hydrolase [Fusarium phyllophilum]|uniref:Epoxide hydrolase n=1 Tax=Fusarium phyllophilum TaxID=47803 RepID=A0A8H5IAY6_9HYPO|nr:epoxide hydrolase [Fusarium phyllophilum]